MRTVDELAIRFERMLNSLLSSTKNAGVEITPQQWRDMEGVVNDQAKHMAEYARIIYGQPEELLELRAHIDKIAIASGKEVALSLTVANTVENCVDLARGDSGVTIRMFPRPEQVDINVDPLPPDDQDDAQADLPFGEEEESAQETLQDGQESTQADESANESTEAVSAESGQAENEEAPPETDEQPTTRGKRGRKAA